MVEKVTYIAFFIGIFPLAIFIISFINIKIKFMPEALEEIIHSINDFPIKNFSYSYICEKNEYYPLLYTFPGSRDGCSCVLVKNYHLEQKHIDEVFPGECNFNQTYNGCYRVERFESIKLFNWRRRKFCSKYYNQEEYSAFGYLYFLNNSVYENEDCKEGYQKCGKLDDKGNYLCIPEGEECPINDIIFSEIELPNLLEENYTYIYLDNIYVYYTNEKKDKPVIVKLKVSEKKVCQYKAYHHTDYPQYILDNDIDKYDCKFKINGTIYDNSIESIDNRTKLDFYKDSNLGIGTSIYNSALYDYPFHSLQEDMILYPKRYIGLDKKCLMENGGLDQDFLISNGQNKYIEKMKNMNTFTIWFSFSFIILELYVTASVDLDDKVCSSLIFWTIFNVLSYAGMGTPIYMNIYNINNFKLFPLCGDSIFNEKISDYNRVAKIFKINNIIQIILINLQIIFTIIIIFILKSKDLCINCKRQNYSSYIDYNKTYENNNTEKVPEKPYYE